MSQTCPVCGLFNPPEALRCDCGYDFKSKTMRGSYVLKDIVEKHGGVAPLVEAQARNSLRVGIIFVSGGLVIAALAFWAHTRDASGGDWNYQLGGGAIITGIAALIRGFRLRQAARDVHAANSSSDRIQVSQLPGRK